MVASHGCAREFQIFVGVATLLVLGVTTPLSAAAQQEVLPIALDCCKITGADPGSACSENFCESNTIPNPCPLDPTAELTSMVSCLEFNDKNKQNACWTSLDSASASVNTSDLIEIIESGNLSMPNGPVFLDDGTKTAVLKALRSRYVDNQIDGSWVVNLPVSECQNPGDGCSSGDAQNLVGFACFEILAVDLTPEKVIRGRFLCSSDLRCG